MHQACDVAFSRHQFTLPKASSSAGNPGKPANIQAMSRRKDNAADADDEYIPVESQRGFGSSIRRKKIDFVSSSGRDLQTVDDTAATAASSSSAQRGSSIGDVYLSIVLGNKDSKNSKAAHGQAADNHQAYSPSQTGATSSSGQVCEVCRLPIDNPSEVSSSKSHEASFAHQVCLPHSHAPSAIDRKRLGYRYLRSYGWDVDSRLGLGPQGHGIRAPLQPGVKNNTVGLGVGDNIDIKDATKTTAATKVTKSKKETLNSKQVRQRAAQDKKKDEKLKQMFFASEEMDKYLDPRRG